MCVGVMWNVGWGLSGVCGDGDGGYVVGAGIGGGRCRLMPGGVMGLGVVWCRGLWWGRV